MNEHTVQKRSKYVILAGLIIFCIVGFITKDITYPLGFILGALGGEIVFFLIIKMSETILKLQQSTMIVVVMFILKMLVYCVCFLLAIFFKDIFSLIGVFAGLMVTRITIYIETYLNKGGESNNE
ncbi:MAG: hypothetical protein PHH04_03415 [Thomasclavelia sp.]|nr:hypothetical protein [Thomasclavelia sp.]